MSPSIQALAASVLLSVSIGVAANPSPESIPGSTYVDGPDARALFDQGVLFIDTRVDADYDAGRVPGAVNFTIYANDPERNQFTEENLLSVLEDKQEPFVLYCNSISCHRTAQATERAVAWGFENAYYYRHGFPDWRSHGYPFE